MSKLYAISGVTGMTGNELVRQILVKDSGDHILGFDNFLLLLLKRFRTLFMMSALHFFHTI